MNCNPHCTVTLLFTMRTESLASSQSCRSVDTDVWCKWGLRVTLMLLAIAGITKNGYSTKILNEIFHPFLHRHC